MYFLCFSYYNNHNRGRGNYYRPSGNYRNGGPNGGYRGGNNFRHRNFNQRNHDNGSTGIPQNDTKTEKPTQPQQPQPAPPAQQKPVPAVAGNLFK